jgi:5'-nucleotidase
MTGILGLSRATMLASVLAVLAAAPAAALNIALTNDDGWDAPGIQAVKAALVAAGHTVSLVAPLDQQSGSSAAINITSNLVIVKRGANEFSVATAGGTEGAEPATCGLIAIDVSEQLTGAPPDLLVSGTNSAANVGAAAQISGTVGAATTAIANSFNGSIPAIAISTDEPCNENNPPGGDLPACVAANEAHYAAVATFLADFVAHLESKPGALGQEPRLLPPGVALNINYPPLAPEDIQGVSVNVQGKTFSNGGIPLVLRFACFGPCNDLPVGGVTLGGLGGAGLDPTPDVAKSDVAAFNAGFITIVPIEADATAKPGIKNSFHSVVNGFESLAGGQQPAQKMRRTRRSSRM